MRIKLLAPFVIILLLLAGCGNNNDKVAGYYISDDMTWTLGNDGSATFEVSSTGRTDHGSFSYNGKEVMIEFPGIIVYTYKVAGNKLIDKDTGEIWNKK